MLKRALNHMAAPGLAWREFLDLAAGLGCVGVEFRNDLPGDLFDGASPESVRAEADKAGLRILALAEVKAFNNWSDEKRDEAAALIKVAKACGAEKVSLIARNDNLGMGVKERRDQLLTALGGLKPLLEKAELVGLIEPLGFETCALRDKGEAVDAIEAVGGRGRFVIVHDTFHHRAAGGGAFFPEHTGIVHISGVTEKGLSDSELRDPMRKFVDADDQIGNVEQLATLLSAGYDGPVSFEPFNPGVLALSDPSSALERSFRYIETKLESRVTR